MRKHRGTPSRRDKHVTPAANSPPGVARGCFVGGQQSGLAGCKPPPLFTRGASSCSSQGRCQGEPWGASPRRSAPTYLPTFGGGLPWPIVRLHLDLPSRHHALFTCLLRSQHVELPCERGLGPQHGEGGDGGGGQQGRPWPPSLPRGLRRPRVPGLCSRWGCGKDRRDVCGAGCIGGGGGPIRGHVEGHLVARLCRSSSVPVQSESLAGVHGRTGLAQPAVPLLPGMRNGIL